MTRALLKWVDSGLNRIGEISIIRETRSSDHAFRLVHHLDIAGPESTPRGELTPYHSPGDAREIVKFNARGEYRPLKTAPDLRRGWELRLADATALREALDYFYPAMIAAWFHYCEGRVPSVPLRETLGRQTGMYRFAREITDADAQELVANHCDSQKGCLKKILWQLDAETPLSGLPPCKHDPGAAPDGLEDQAIPLLCQEACNLVVGEARRVSKRAAEARKRAGGKE